MLEFVRAGWSHLRRPLLLAMVAVGVFLSLACHSSSNDRPPSITGQPANLTVASGAIAAFTASADGTPAPTFIWQRSVGSTWTDITGATGTSYTFTATAADDTVQFRMVAANGSGTAASNAATLRVQHLSITTQPTAQVAVAPALATFAVVAAGNPTPTYQWQRSNDGGTVWADISGATAASFSTAATSAADNGAKFHVLVSNGVSAALISQAVALTVNVAPTITTQPASLTLTAPAAATFTGAATGLPTPTYQWQRSNDGGTTWSDITGATAAAYSLASTSASDNGAKFRLVASNGIGTAATSAVATLTMNSAPGITTQPASQTVVAPATGTFTVVATGLPAPSYQWQRSDDAGSTWANVASGGTTASYSTAATSAADHGAKFRVVLSNGIGTAATSSAATLTVNVAPSITTQPVGQTVTAPANASFTVVGTGLPTPTIQWQRSNDGGTTWADVTGATSATYTTAATSASDNGAKFHAVLSNSIGTAATSTAVTLTVNVAPAITTQPGSQTVVAPAPGTFTVVATGLPAPSYQWQRSDDAGSTWANVASGGTTASYSTAATSATDHGARFRVVATNGIGTAATSSAATLTVNVAPSITTQPVSQTIISPGTATFTVAGTGLPTPTTQWQRSDDAGSTWADVAGATSATYTTAATSASDNGAKFHAVLSNSIGTAATSSAVTLTVCVAPSITSQPTNQTVTSPGAATFTVVGTGLPPPTYRWQRSDDAGSTWADIPGATSTSYTTGATSAADNSAKFRVILLDGFGAALTATSSAATLTVNVAPAITTQPVGQTVTAPATASFTVASTGLPTPTIQWQRSNDGGTTWADVSGATSATYSTAATSAADNSAKFRAVLSNGIGSAATSAAVTLTVNVAPAITTQPTPQTVTSPATATFSVAGTGLPTPPIQWQRSNDGGTTWADITGATSVTYTTAATTGTDDAAKFRAVLSNGIGSAATSTAVLLTVNVEASITSQPSSISVTTGATGAFSVVATGLPTPTYQWQRSNDSGSTWANVASGTGGTTASYSTAATALADSGSQFRVLVTNGIGTVKTSSVGTLTVTGVAPTITVQPLPQWAAATQTATFSAAASGTPTPTYQWQRNNGSGWVSVSSGSGATSATYTTDVLTTADNNAQFRVHVSNAAGAVDSNAVTLVVNPATPTIVTQPLAASVISPATATFSVFATGEPTPSYQWQRSVDSGVTWADLSNGTGSTTNAYTTPATVPTDNAALYRVKLNNGGADVFSNTVLLSVNVYKLTNGTVSNANLDAVLDSTNSGHLVYDRDGHVYYRKDAGAEEDLGPGTFPAIAVGSDLRPQVVFNDGLGNISHAVKTAGTWATSTALSSYNASYSLSLDVDSSNFAHLAFDNGSGYGAIIYANNTTGTFADTVTALAVGAYWGGGSGGYYRYAVLKLDASGYYHIAYRYDNWGGRASWSARSIGIMTNNPAGNPGGSSGFDWNGGASLGRRCLALDGSGNFQVIYNGAGTIYRAVANASGWTETSITTGSQEALAVNGSTVDVTWNTGSNKLSFITDTGAGFGAPTPVGTGASPVSLLAANGSRYFCYLSNDGVADQVYVWVNEAP